MKISIIIATKNEEQNIERLLTSLKKQTFKDFEIIIVDNFSKDKTLKIAQKYTKNTFKSGPERSAQRNFGLKKSNGSYILFLDADMEPEESVLKECFDILDKDKKTKGVIIEEKSVGKSFLSRVKTLEKELYLDVSNIEAARFFRKKDLIKIGAYDQNLISGEDWDLTERIKKIGNIKRIKAQIKHWENQSLAHEISKKYYYAKYIKYYAKKYPKRFKDQSDIRLRLKILFRNPKLVLEHPLEFIGLILLKFTQYLVYLFAGLSNYVK